jgi:outer membrane protein assembly factor BamB
MRNHVRKKLLTSAVALVTAMTLTAQTSEWRGPDRTGVYNETNLLKQWPATGPKMVWETTGVGTGYSAVTPTADAIYITGRKDSVDVITSISHDGKKNWEMAYGKAWNRTYPESRATPTIVDGLIYLVSGQGEIVCVSVKGERIWSVNHFAKYQASPPRFGISESPLVVGNIVVVTPGGNIASMAAFDTKTGKLVWEAPPVNEGAQYINPKYIEYGGRKMIITMTADNILAISATDGKLIWKVSYAAQQTGTGRRTVNHATTPIYRDGKIFVNSGYDHTAVQLKLSADGSSAEVVWKNDDIDTHHGGVVLIGNQLFASNYQNNTMGQWTSVDWATGKTLWVSPWHNKGSIISADGMLYLFEEKSGHVGLARPSSEKLDIVSEFRLPTKSEGPYWAHPVIHNGRLYVRHGDYLAVYNIKK